LLRINGPFRTFYLWDIVRKDLVFLATGTGIAPIKAILELLINKSRNEQPESVIVFWGGRGLTDLY
jgi:CDP-4-dehydro-6-deoxyglucose reductase